MSSFKCCLLSTLKLTSTLIKFSLNKETITQRRAVIFVTHWHSRFVGSISWFLVAFNAHLYPASSVGRSIRPLVVIILFERLPAFWLRRSTAPLFYCSTAATAPTLMPIALKAPNAFHIIAPKKKEAKEKKRTHCT